MSRSGALCKAIFLLVLLIPLALSSPIVPSSNSECGLSAVQPRIAYGNSVPRGKFPWLTFLSVEKYGKKYICAGSLIGKRIVATAAHCFGDPKEALDASSIKVFIGAHDLDQTDKDPVPVKSVLISDKFDIHNFVGGDQAILILEDEIKDEDAMPICLLSSDTSIYRDSQLTIVGWGLTENGRLQTPKMTNINYLPTKYCYQNAGTSFVYDAEFCGHNRVSGSCHGDSGGPLMWQAPNNRWYLLGIISRGDTTDCISKKRRPTVFSKIDIFLKNLIDQKILDKSEISFGSFDF